MEDILEFLKKEKIVPVAVLEKEEDGVLVSRALLDGGVRSIEVTFRTKAAKNAIEKISKECPEMVVGAGTIINQEQAKQAIEAGAKFIVSPAYVEEVVDYCMEKEVAVIPGCVTPTEFLWAQKKGLKVAKFFPAEQYGGIKTLKAIGAVLSNLYFMPTGGINEENLKEYLAYDRVCACGGSFMVAKSLIEKKEYNKITEMVKKCKNSLPK